MMRITVNKNATGLVNYFTKSLRQDDYFFTGQKTPGYFHGRLREELNLPKEVSQKLFSCLAHNIHPVSGKRLTQRQDKQRRTSIEYMFSAPKSVSLIMALSDAETGRSILNIHRRAVRKTMQEIEADMQTQTRIQGRKVYANTGNIVYARFDHFTSRPTGDMEDKNSAVVSDPNLHSHAVVFNLTKYNNRFQAIEGSTIHKCAQYYENLYHAYLSKGLQDFGFDIRRTKDRYEIHSPGMTRRTLEKFSRRTLEIEHEAKSKGITDAKKKAGLGAKTRKAKSKAKPNIDLKEDWLSRLTAIEKAAIAKAHKGVKSNSGTGAGSITAQKAIQMSLHHHLERRSTVATKSLLAYAMDLGYGKLDIKQLKSALAQKQDIVYGTKRYIQYCTTIDRIRQEDRMIEFASATKASRVALHKNYLVKKDFLSPEQRSAIDKILRSTDQVNILAGGAGTGKTTVLQEIHQAHTEKGKHVIALAQSATASREVLVDNGFKSADTIASFLQNKKMQEASKNQTILVDEAGLLGVRDMSAIFNIAEKQNTRVLLVGDTRQHTSPSYGDALRLLIDKSGIQPARIEKIQRQRPNPQYKAAIKSLAAGKTIKGFDKLDKINAIVEIEDIDKRHRQIASDYADALDQKRSALVISPTHKEGNKLSDLIRQEMKTRGRIQGGEKDFTIQKIIPMTEAQKMDMAKYETGMVIQFFQNAKGFKAGQKYVVKSTDKDKVMVVSSSKPSTQISLPMEQGKRFQVFKPGQIKLAKGDQLRITQNGKTISKARIFNGQQYTVQGFTKSGDIKLNGGKTLDKDFGHISHGYVSTSHAAQGRTCDDVYIAQSAMSYGASSEKQFYVSASRARQRIRIYTEDKQRLRTAISKSGDRLSARELAGNRFKTNPTRSISKQRQKQKIRNQRRHLFYQRMIKIFTHDTRSITRDQRQIQRTLEH